MLALIALQLAVAQPALRPAPRTTVQPRQTEVNLITRKQAMLGDADKLLAQAGKLRDANRSAGKMTGAEIDAAVEALKNQRDSISQMGEMDALQMQQAMDRMSKMMATLSNIMKKSSETSQTIVQNLK
jgi:hypothetical protein